MAHVNYKDVVIGINDSVKHALEVLDARALRIALICDESDKLLGVVTDGDIRRGILNGVTLTDTVEQVMHRSPVTITKDVSRRQAAALMQAKNILAIPVVENGYLIGLETLQKFKSASLNSSGFSICRKWPQSSKIFISKSSKYSSIPLDSL